MNKTYKFSTRSIGRLTTCDKELQEVMHSAIKYIDFTILEGYRDEFRQNEMVERGLSKLKWPHSKHNSTPSLAVDVAPWPIDWNDHNRFYFLAGIILGISNEMKIPIRWGGDWDRDYDLKDNRFDDLCHFELIT